MKKQWVLILGVVLVFGLLLSACAMNSDDGQEYNGIKYSVQVNNQAAARSIAAGDTVELYIRNFEYNEDANHRGLILIANGDRDMGSKGGILDNAGWYSADAYLEVTNDVNNGPYSSFKVRISKLKVNGTEYDFPYGGNGNQDGVFFGNPPSIWNGGQADYPDNFSGITMTDSVHSLKTVLTVEADILDESGKLIADPYSKIKVEGRINE